MRTSINHRRATSITPRTKRLNITLTPAEYTELRNEAKRRHMATGAYAAMCTWNGHRGYTQAEQSPANHRDNPTDD